MVKRRDSLIQGIIVAKNQLNAQLTYVYPSYKEYFCDVDTKTAMYFWETYPHPKYLKGLQSEALLEELRTIHRGITVKKVQEILMLSEQNSLKEKAYQLERDFVIKSLIRELRFKKQENEDIDKELEKLISLTGYKRGIHQE